MLKKDYPELFKIWNHERNSEDGISFDEVSIGSGKKVWWKCEKGHEWEASVYHIANGTRCPYCANKKALPGYNDLATVNPRLAKEWNYEKNVELLPEHFLPKSNKKVWWKCEKGHEWEAFICDRDAGNGCPICAGKIVIAGFNDLVTVNPQLASEWNYKKNGNLKPTDVTAGSSRKVWWICKDGHEWEASISNRSKDHGCPFCSGRNAILGQNDLATLNPKLAGEWNYEKNGSLKPEDVTSSSPRIVWWKCKNGHEWEASISNRSKGRECPYCSNKKVLPGFNDLATVNPEVAKEWDYEKNGNLKPTDVVAGSTEIVWWKCKKRHEWRAVVYSRNNGRNCPVCSQDLHISFPEKVLFFYIRQAFPDAVENYKAPWLGKKELDIYIPSIRTGVEFDGVFYHKRTERDIEKDVLCNKQGVTLIRIREKGLDDTGLTSIVFTLPEELNGSIERLMPSLRFIEGQLGKSLDIDLLRDYDEIRSMVVNHDLENCVANTHPALLDEWDYEKNEQVGNTPENVSAGARIAIWWKCKNGHSYKALINNRTSNHNGCPYCVNKKVLKGFNDLVTIKPEIAKEWNYEKNEPLKPEETLSSSNKKVWWRCSECGEEWMTSPALRKNTRCRKCNRKDINAALVSGVNDLYTTNPEVAKMWNYDKNGALTPKDVTVGSGKKVWWKCPKGHEWEAIVYNISKHKSGCPYCSGRRKL